MISEIELKADANKTRRKSSANNDFFRSASNAPEIMDEDCEDLGIRRLYDDEATVVIALKA
jgi:hypothetical protein